MKKYLLLAWVLFVALSAEACGIQSAQASISPVKNKHYRYRISLTDKKDCGYSIKCPEAFLSAKSIARRKRYGLKVDEYDLPVSQHYLKGLKDLGLSVRNVSKWNNTVVVETIDTLLIQKARKLPYVSETRCVWISPDSVEQSAQVDRYSLLVDRRDTLTNYYGHAATQVEMLGVEQLHRAGYKGEGVTIAVIDGGFYNADLVKGLKQAKVLGVRNFVSSTRSVYEEQSHGMMVLSCIAANVPYSLVGTAPEASFYLLQSEDGASEQLIEEDNWCTAVEYADSLGCDIITSSLGYYHFDHDFMLHKYQDQNGMTALNSRSASLAASRGLLMLNSAGNEGDEHWKKIGFPADGRDILAVGAVTAERQNTLFSSIGNTSDGRIKPDVMAMGQSAAVYDVDGCVAKANGTSFACPIMCGAVACLVQAYPHKSPVEIIHALQQSGDNASYPNNIYGYGIPYLPKAMQLLKK